MIALFLTAVLLVAAVVIFAVAPRPFNFLGALGAAALSALVFALGAVSYNQSGFCTHYQTIFGTEGVKCDLGWYPVMYGTSTKWSYEITVAHTDDASTDGSAVRPPKNVRMADNWNGFAEQVTRFSLPRDEESFIRIVRSFRSPDGLVSRNLLPSVEATLDSVANLYTMEEYYSDGGRDEFKNEFEQAIRLGRPNVLRRESVEEASRREERAAAAADVNDTAEDGGAERVRSVVERITDENGMVVRSPHAFSEFGIAVQSAIFVGLTPDPLFEQQIVARKEAAARRAVAREQRLEETEQRLFVIERAQREIAQRQGEAEVVQIQRTTEAETERQLALIEADRERQRSLIQADQRKQQADVDRETAAINLERARLEAEAVRVAAEAEAFAKEAILEADGALAQKLDAWVSAQRFWADAFARRNVPTTVLGAGGSEGGDSGVVDFMNLMTMRAAQELAVDVRVQPGDAQ